MKQHFVFVSLLVIICSTLAFAALELENSAHPDHPGKCWSSSEKLAHNVGDVWGSANSCVQFSCSAELYTTSASCGVVGASHPCFVNPPDLSKAYPDCCSTVTCP